MIKAYFILHESSYTYNTSEVERMVYQNLKMS